MGAIIMLIQHVLAELCYQQERVEKLEEQVRAIMMIDNHD